MIEDMNLFEQNLEDKPVQRFKTPHTSDFPVGIFDQRHLYPNLQVIKFGTTRPDGSSDIKAFFNTSSGVLSCWDGTQWLSTTLS